MRLRKKWWARPEMEQTSIFVKDAYEIKGHWGEEFKNSNPIELELGVGRGSFITTKALENPNTNYIGVDLKDEVLVYTVRKIEENELENVKITALDIMRIDGVFAKQEVSKIYINFCNPWPKARHNKRRLTHTRQLKQYKEFLKANGEIWFKTDDLDLFNDSLEYFEEQGFELKYKTYDLHSENFEGNIVTEYENKFVNRGIKIKFCIAKLK